MKNSLFRYNLLNHDRFVPEACSYYKELDFKFVSFMLFLHDQTIC